MTSDNDDSNYNGKENLSASPSSSRSSSACGAPSPNIDPPEAAALATDEDNQLSSTDDLVSTQSQDSDGQGMNHHDHSGDEGEDERGDNNDVIRSRSTDGGIIDRHSDKDVHEFIDDALDGLPLPNGMAEAVLNETTKPVEQIQDNEVPAENLSASLAASLEATNRALHQIKAKMCAMENRGVEDDNIVSSRESIEREDDVEVGNNLESGEGGVETPAVDPIQTSSDNFAIGHNAPEENIESETRSNNLLDATATNRESQSAEMYVAQAYAVEESDQDIVIATRTPPWWKQRKTKIFLGTVCLVVIAMAIALGVSMSSSSGGEPLVVVVVRTDTPSKSLVPTSIPSVSLRPSVHPSLPPTTTPSQSPTFTRFESLKIVADDGAADARFGDSVAIFGTTLVVGTWSDDDKGDYSGSAYIYHRYPESKEWIMHQKLVPDDKTARDWFGSSVAVFGDTLIVGARWDDTDKGTNSGSAYIYHQDSEAKKWILQQKLVPDDGAADDRFGSSVTIYDSTIVVGAQYDDDKGRDSGSAYIYHQDPETKEWILRQKLVPDDGAAEDQFGDSVAVYSNTIVVGALYDDTDNHGSAYIYHQDPETKEWILQQKLVPYDGDYYDFFGSSVAIYGNTVVVGAIYDDDKGSASGSAYIYNRAPTTKEWIFQQKLVPDDGAAEDQFGENVAIFGDTLVVGAKWDDDKGDSSGSAYVYHQDQETKEWILQQKIVADDGAAGDWFGESAAIYNGTIVVGARGDTDKGYQSGSVYVYSYPQVLAKTLKEEV